MLITRHFSQPYREALKVGFLIFLLAGTNLVSASESDPLTFTTVDGTQYDHVTVTRVEPNGITVMGETGIIKIPFQNLPTDIQKNYDYDPAKAEDFRVKQAAKYAETARNAKATQAVAARNAEIQKAQAAQASKVEAALAAVTVKPPPGTIGKLGVNILYVWSDVTVFSKDGILLVTWENRTLERVGDNWGSILMYKPLMIVGETKGLVNGDTFTGVIYPAGIYEYTDTGRTVPRYATSPQLAAKLLTK